MVLAAQLGFGQRRRSTSLKRRPRDRHLRQGVFPPDDTIQRILDERVAENRVFGIVVATRDANGKTRFYHAGSAAQDGVVLDGNAVFELGSVTKTFTTALLADMVIKGEVKLDDPVAKYLPPSVKMPARSGKQITLVDLATHSSGLPLMPANMPSPIEITAWADYKVDQMYQFLSGYELTRDIGEKFEYSNAGMCLLGHVLALARERPGRSAVGTNPEAVGHDGHQG